jgi:hypothetical protein
MRRTVSLFGLHIRRVDISDREQMPFNSPSLCIGIPFWSPARQLSADFRRIYNRVNKTNFEKQPACIEPARGVSQVKAALSYLNGRLHTTWRSPVVIAIKVPRPSRIARFDVKHVRVLSDSRISHVR